MDKASLGQGPEGAATGDKALVAPPNRVTPPVSIPASNEMTGEAPREEEERTLEFERNQEQERTLEFERPVTQVHADPKKGSLERPAREGSGDAQRTMTPRPMRLTPGGGYGALLAHSRPKHHQSDLTDAKAKGRVEASVPSFGRAIDPLEITAAGGPPSESRSGDVGVSVGQRPRTITPEQTEPTGSDFGGAEITVVGGAVRTPVLDVGSGAGTADSGTQRKSPIPRPTRLTPGSGGLAALLAQGRSRARKEQPAVDREAPTQPPAIETPTIAPLGLATATIAAQAIATAPFAIRAPASPPIAIEGQAEPSREPVPPSAQEVVKSGFKTTLRPGVLMAPQAEQNSAPASLPEVKKTGLAGTLLGVPPPEIDFGEAGGPDAPWVKRFSGVGPNDAPRNIGDVEWTERNSEIPRGDSGGLTLGDSDSASGAAGFVPTAADRRRITASFDVPRANLGHRRAIGAGIAAAVLVTAVGVFWPRSHPSVPASKVTGGTASAPVVEPVPSQKNALPVEPRGQPAAVPHPSEAASAVGASAPSPEAMPEKGAPSPVPAPGPTTAPTQEPSAAIAAPAPTGAGQGAEPAAHSASDEPANRPVAPSEVDEPVDSMAEALAPSARKKGKGKAKTKKKSAASHSHKEPSGIARSAEVKPDAPRGRVPAAEDPDGTLPLMGH